MICAKIKMVIYWELMPLLLKFRINFLRHVAVIIQFPASSLTVPGIQIHPSPLQTCIHPVVSCLRQVISHPLMAHPEYISLRRGHTGRTEKL